MIEELEQENRLLRSRNERLESERKNWVYITKEDIKKAYEDCLGTQGKPQGYHYQFASRIEETIRRLNDK